MKRFLALALSLIMLLGMFAGCTSQQGSGEVIDGHEAVTIHFYTFGFAGQQDADMVYAEVNKLIQEIYPWITVEFHISNSADYVTHLTLAQVSEDPIDLISTFKFNYHDEISKGSYMDITDYEDQFPALWSALPEWTADYTTVNGRRYGFINYQALNAMNYASGISKEYADHFGLDVEALEAAIASEEFLSQAYYDEVLKFMEGVQATGQKVAILPCDASHALGLGVAVRGYEQIAGPLWIEYNDEECKLVNIFETDAAKRYLKNIYEWNEKGLIPKGFYEKAYSVTDLVKDPVSGSLLFNMSLTNYAYNSPQLQNVRAGWEAYFFPTNKSAEDYYISSTNAAGMMAVSATSKHPEDALRVLELLYTNAELENMLVYGLEGEHYITNEDGTITTLDYEGGQAQGDARYGMHKWAIGNSSLAKINQSFDQGYWDWSFVDLPQNGQRSNLMGFSLDTSSFTNELAQITAITTEYANILTQVGSKNWEADLQAYLDKLDAAGVDSVMDKIQTQIDNFLASKK